MLHKLFFEQKMTWKKVILLAVATAILAAAVLVLPVVKDTSVSYIGVTFECWILFALIIIMNCETPLEAGLKTFVFFLISQPLIYLLQVPFNPLGWGIFGYYPRWAVWTVLCFPGAMLAWFVKKDKWYSALILAVATCYLSAVCVDFSVGCIRNFPNGLIAAVFCAVLAVVLIFTLLQKKHTRLIAGGLTLIAAIIAAVLMLQTNPAPQYGADFGDVLDSTHTWEIVSQEENVGTVTVAEDGHTLHVSATNFGEQEITVQNEDGETVVLVLTYEKPINLQLDQKQD